MTNNEIANVKLVAEDTNDKITSRICKRLSLGINVDTELEMVYLLQNCIFSLTYGAPILKDDDYDSLLEMVHRIYNKCNKILY